MNNFLPCQLLEVENLKMKDLPELISLQQLKFMFQCLEEESKVLPLINLDKISQKCSMLNSLMLKRKRDMFGKHPGVSVLEVLVL